MLRYLFILLNIPFSNFVFADGIKSHVYNVSPYPVKAWARYQKPQCDTYTMEMNPNTPPWDWSPPPGCGLLPLMYVNYEFTDKNGETHKYWITGPELSGNSNRHAPIGTNETDICIYGDPTKDSYNPTGTWQPCKLFDEICKDPAYDSKCETRTGDKPD